MSETVHLALPYIAAAQAQKHVTHNEALRMLDALVMLAAKDRDLSAPPGSPAEGDRYLVNPTGTGAFAGHDNAIAHYRDGAWAFHAPQAGWICYIEDEDTPLIFDGSAWVPLLGATPELQNLARLGIGTIADATNPFSARLNNALWTARTAAEGGDGDLRYKLNKEAAGNTLSLLFQTGYSGRAEIGLTADDDLHLKVSDDGATWRDAMVVAAADGRVSFPSGIAGARERLAAPRTYYVRTDGSDANDGLSDSAGGAFLTLQKAADVVFGTLDLGGHDVTVQVADGSYAEGVHVIGPQVGAGSIVFQGNAANPENVIVDVSATACFRAANAALIVKDMELRTTGGMNCLTASSGALIQFGNVRFGACGGFHIRTEIGSLVEAVSNYSIVGGATSHINMGLTGVARLLGRTVTVTGTPAFTSFAQGSTGGMLVVTGSTFSGAATGQRYSLTTNSAINGAGGSATLLPGDVAGSASSGGEYV